jgi:hypothetical protein
MLTLLDQGVYAEYLYFLSHVNRFTPPTQPPFRRPSADYLECQSDNCGKVSETTSIRKGFCRPLWWQYEGVM